MVKDFMEYVINKDPEEIEFHQAVSEVLESVTPVMERNPHYRRAKILVR